MMQFLADRVNGKSLINAVHSLPSPSNAVLQSSAADLSTTVVGIPSVKTDASLSSSQSKLSSKRHTPSNTNLSHPPRSVQPIVRSLQLKTTMTCRDNGMNVSQSSSRPSSARTHSHQSLPTRSTLSSSRNVPTTQLTHSIGQEEQREEVEQKGLQSELVDQIESSVVPSVRKQVSVVPRVKKSSLITCPHRSTQLSIASIHYSHHSTSPSPVELVDFHPFQLESGLFYSCSKLN